MGWTCEKCSKKNSYRTTVCTKCQEPISENEIQEKFRSKAESILDKVIEKRKRINIPMVLLSVILMVICFFSMKDFSISYIRQHLLNQVIEKNTYIADNYELVNRKTWLDLKEGIGVSLLHKLGEGWHEKSVLISANLHGAVTDKSVNRIKPKEFRKLSIKTVDTGKIKQSGEKLWGIICRIRSWF